jgi:hypothetical protein
MSIYAANSSQNAISIYLAKSASGSAPNYQIGGSSTTLDGPQYLAFDSSGNLWVTNYDASTGVGQIEEFKALAIGNVLPFGGITFPGGFGQARGIAIFQSKGYMVVGSDVPTATTPALPSQLQFFTTADSGPSTPFLIVTGAGTGLNVPSGVAFDSSGNAFVANRQGASVESFVIPTPTPTPASTPSPTPSPTPTPVGATPSPTPTPVTQNYQNLTPATAIVGASTGLVNPTGVALDSAGNIYVSDAGNPSVRVFATGATGNVPPIRVIAGASTGFVLPTDVKVDSTGQLYVADQGANKIFVFAPLASGNVAPMSTYPAIGSLVGIGLTP